MSDEKRRSKLALAIEGRERKLYPFEVQGFFGLGDKAIHSVAIRVATKREEDKAVALAHAYVNKCTDLAEARSDGDLLNDAKLAEILFEVCRDADDPKYPAFPYQGWIREHLTTDQIATLINLYHEARKHEGPLSWDIDYQIVEDLAEVCAKTSGTDVPEALLANRPREWLSQAFVMLAERWQALRPVEPVDNGDEDPMLGAVEIDGGDGQG